MECYLQCTWRFVEHQTLALLVIFALFSVIPSVIRTMTDILFSLMLCRTASHI